MGKKNKRRDDAQTPSPEVSTVLQQLAASAVARMSARTRETTEGMAARLSATGNFGLIRWSRRVGACCPSGERDGIIVMGIGEQGLERAAASDGAMFSPERTVLIIAVDEHSGQYVRLSMDVESMEQHVNNCTEVLAYLRDRAATR